MPLRGVDQPFRRLSSYAPNVSRLDLGSGDGCLGLTVGHIQPAIDVVIAREQLRLAIKPECSFA